MIEIIYEHRMSLRDSAIRHFIIHKLAIILLSHAKNFVYTAITVTKQMPVEKSCSAILNVHPVQPATKPVRISKRNGAADLIRRLMYVMAVQ